MSLCAIGRHRKNHRERVLSMSLVSLDSFFAELAQASGEIILPYFRMPLVVDDKNPGQIFDPVTEADRGAEQVIRQLIKARYPDHAIRGEEFGLENEGAAYEWVIDPIDGTRAFICGLPTWGTLVGLKHHGKPFTGMMNQPHIGERFMGDGKDAWMITGGDKKALRTRKITRLSDAFIATTSPRIIMGSEAKAYDRLEQQCKLARYGTDCYAYAMLAAGQIDLVVETGLQAYDVAGLIPIVEGAGGMMTTWSGGSASEGGSILAAGSQALHNAAMECLAKA
jgi:histidinol phosphatase-like enzyme (inositol monophosphatase family)